MDAREIKKYFVIAAYSGIIGFGAGLITGLHLFSPYKVYEKDYNRDNIRDIVIVQRDGPEVIYLKDKNGRFNKLGYSEHSKKENLKKKSGVLREKLMSNSIAANFSFSGF